MADRTSYWAQRTASRRTALRGTGIAGAGVAGLALVGCGDDDGGGARTTVAVSTPRPAASSTATAKRGGKITDLGVPGFTYQNIDPHATVYTTPFTAKTTSLLAYWDDTEPDVGNQKVVADAAASWETPDKTTYIFHLRDNIKFHILPPANGRAATSEDVKFSLERIGITDPRFFRQNDFKSYGMQITTPDANTVILKFPAPMASFWPRITTPGTVILPKEVGSTVITSTDPIAGTGPFMHKSFVADRSFTVVRNPDYFLKDRPYLDSVESLYFGMDSETQYTQFKSRTIDIWNVGNRDQWEDVKKISGVTRDRRVGLHTQWLCFNTKKAPFSDPRVRKALSLAIPRQEIVTIAHLGEEQAVLQGPAGLNPWIHGSATLPYDELRKRPGYRAGKEQELDVAEAKKLLSAAGATSFSGTLKYAGVTSTWPFADTLATLLQDAFKPLGFDFKLQSLSYPDVLVELPTLNWDILHTAQLGTSIDPDDYLSTYFAPNGSRNYPKWSNDEYNRLNDQQKAAGTVEERNKTIRQMIELIDAENPRASTTILTERYAWWDRVQGYHGRNSFPNPTTAIHDIWVKDA